MFYIADRRLGLPIFMGRVEDPSDDMTKDGAVPEPQERVDDGGNRAMVVDMEEGVESTVGPGGDGHSLFGSNFRTDMKPALRTPSVVSEVFLTFRWRKHSRAGAWAPFLLNTNVRIKIFHHDSLPIINIYVEKINYEMIKFIKTH